MLGSLLLARETSCGACDRQISSMLRRVRKSVFGSKKKSSKTQADKSSVSDIPIAQKVTNEQNNDFDYTTTYDMHTQDEVCDIVDLNSVRRETLKQFLDKPFPVTQRKYFASDYAVSRYLIAAKMNASTAGKNLAATLLWREDRGLLDDSTPLPDHYHNSFVPVGLDRRKYMIIYSNHARADPPLNQNAESQFDHAFRVLETACNDGLGISRTLWVIDFNGFGRWTPSFILFL